MEKVGGKLHVTIDCPFHSLFSGLIPVPVRPPHTNNISSTLPTVKMVVEVSKARALLTVHSITKVLKSKEAASVVEFKSWPMVLESDDAPKRRLTNPYRAPTPEMIAYLDFSVSTTGMLSGVKVRARLHEPRLAANPGQVASPGPPFSSQTLVQLQAFDWKRVDPGWRPDSSWQPTQVHVNGPEEINHLPNQVA